VSGEGTALNFASHCSSARAPLGEKPSGSPGIGEKEGVRRAAASDELSQKVNGRMALVYSDTVPRARGSPGAPSPCYDPLVRSAG
jgi:hypothetical protein